MPTEPQPITLAGVVHRAVEICAHRRDLVDADAVKVLRLAVRAEFDEHPPEEIGRWLEARGI
jgi:hypothetical protein